MSLKVLLAEDDPVMIELMREVFVQHSVTVRQIQDADAAAVIDREKFDGVFTNLMLLNLDGYGLIRKIRESSWNGKTPVVIVSENGDTATRIRAFEAGASFFLEKPVDRVTLTRLLKSTRGAMVEERRRTKRIPFSTEVACVMGNIRVLGTSMNISRDGLLFQNDGTLKLGRPVRLQFQLEPQKPVVKARGVVVRVDDGKRAGIRFVPEGSEDGLRVREFIAKEVGTL